jgi:hypothetical protein
MLSLAVLAFLTALVVGALVGLSEDGEEPPPNGAHFGPDSVECGSVTLLSLVLSIRVMLEILVETTA